MDRRRISVFLANIQDFDREFFELGQTLIKAETDPGEGQSLLDLVPDILRQALEGVQLIAPVCQPLLESETSKAILLSRTPRSSWSGISILFRFPDHWRVPKKARALGDREEPADPAPCYLPSYLLPSASSPKSSPCRRQSQIQGVHYRYGKAQDPALQFRLPVFQSSPVQVQHQVNRVVMQQRLEGVARLIKASRAMVKPKPP